jgi:hypothetical protein
MNAQPKNDDGYRVIVVHTNYDETTRITSTWASDLISVVPAHAQLHGEKANSANLREVLENATSAALIAFYGHGTETKLLGHQQVASSEDAALIGLAGETLLPPALSRHRIYAVACWAGSELGPALRDAGAEFIGYQYAFHLAPGFHHRFKEIVNGGAAAWVNGMDGQQVWQQLYNDWDAFVVKKRHRNAAVYMSEDTFAAVFAQWNRDSLVYHRPKQS